MLIYLHEYFLLKYLVDKKVCCCKFFLKIKFVLILTYFD